MEIDDDRVEVIVTRILNGKLENYRHIRLCDERFKEVAEVKDDMKALIKLNIVLLISIIGTLVAVIAK